MDDIVAQAMRKWPKVPACHGWLGLDARGQWLLRDAAAQALGAFDSGVPGAKGSVLAHAGLIDFIGRNYSADVAGCWYFQNGPQRVFVELEATPLIWRVQPDLSLQDHRGGSATYQQCWVDETGRVYLLTDRGFGLVPSQDVALAADAIERGRWLPQDILQSVLPARFGFVKSPQALHIK
ncbi:MAG: DUF2946 family protein [Rhodoferax sp.]|nr:DUF2946 family protein [Rhodoferax sp.]